MTSSDHEVSLDLFIILFGHLAILRLRLAGAVGAEITVRSSYSQWGPTMTRIRSQILIVASPALHRLHYLASPFGIWVTL